MPLPRLLPYVAGALGELAPSYVRLPGRTLYVARRSEVAADRVLCGLADTRGAKKPELLPTDQNNADLVLALAEGGPTVGDVGANRRVRNVLLTLWWRVAASFNRKLGIATLALFALLGLGTVLFASGGGFAWGDAL